MSATQKVGGEGGALFWFDWKEISQVGHQWYGRYVYEKLLPCFSPANDELLALAVFVFFDGDMIKGGEIPYSNLEDRACLEEVIRRGTERIYVVAVYSTRAELFSIVEEALRRDPPIGYLGCTRCPLDFESFFRLAVEQLALCHTLRIALGRWQWESGAEGLLSDEELSRMGFFGSLPRGPEADAAKQELPSSLLEKAKLEDHQVLKQERTGFKQQLRELLTKHIERLHQAHAGDSRLALTLHLVQKLLEPEKLDYAVGTIDKQLFEAIGKRRHVFSSKSFRDLFLVISTVPAYKIERAREFFAPAGYLRFLEEQGLHLAAQAGRCAAHWIFCVEPEGKRGMVHLTFFPDVSQVPQERWGAILAYDMFTPSERARLRLWRLEKKFKFLKRQRQDKARRRICHIFVYMKTQPETKYGAGLTVLTQPREETLQLMEKRVIEDIVKRRGNELISNCPVTTYRRYELPDVDDRSAIRDLAGMTMAVNLGRADLPYSWEFLQMGPDAMFFRFLVIYVYES